MSFREIPTTNSVHLSRREEMLAALRVRWSNHNTDEGFRKIPPMNDAEKNAEYDVGYGPRKYNLGTWIHHEITAYKNGRRVDQEMEELVNALSLTGDEIEEFRRRCGWRVNGESVHLSRREEAPGSQ